jgi:hypothetical protein
MERRAPEEYALRFFKEKAVGEKRCFGKRKRYSYHIPRIR